MCENFINFDYSDVEKKMVKFWKKEDTKNTVHQNFKNFLPTMIKIENSSKKKFSKLRKRESKISSIIFHHDVETTT